MYARTVEHDKSEQILTFGVSGKLIMNVLVMYDRQTGTYWSQILGEAVEGPLKGVKLTPIAALQTTWGEWKTLYPDTKALVTNGTGGYDRYDDYYSSGSAGVLGETREDDRLQRKQLVTGAVIGGQPVAYPHAVLAQTPVANDEVNGEPLLIVYEPAADTTAIFQRRLGDSILTFAPGSDQGSFVDEETGSTWSLLTGRATDGPHAGMTLTRVPSTTSFWFGWKDWYPDTLLFEGR